MQNIKEKLLNNKIKILLIFIVCILLSILYGYFNYDTSSEYYKHMTESEKIDYSSRKSTNVKDLLKQTEVLEEEIRIYEKKFPESYLYFFANQSQFKQTIKISFDYSNLFFDEKINEEIRVDSYKTLYNAIFSGTEDNITEPLKKKEYLSDSFIGYIFSDINYMAVADDIDYLYELSMDADEINLTILGESSEQLENRINKIKEYFELNRQKLEINIWDIDVNFYESDIESGIFISQNDLNEINSKRMSSPNDKFKTLKQDLLNQAEIFLKSEELQNIQAKNNNVLYKYLIKFALIGVILAVFAVIVWFVILATKNISQNDLNWFENEMDFVNLRKFSKELGCNSEQNIETNIANTLKLIYNDDCTHKVILLSNVQQESLSSSKLIDELSSNNIKITLFNKNDDLKVFSGEIYDGVFLYYDNISRGDYLNLIKLSKAIKFMRNIQLRVFYFSD